MSVRADQLREKEDYQRYIIDKLKEKGYRERKAKEHYNQVFAMDTDLLIEYLNITQKDKIDKLHHLYKDDYISVILNTINKYILNRNNTLIDAFHEGVEFDDGTTLNLYSPAPDNNYNDKALFDYQNNILSVMEEVYHKEEERIDLVVFLNGIAIFTIELKCNTSGQDVNDAILQYKDTRDETTRLFLYKKGVLAAFAMDLNEVYFTTKLSGRQSYFNPFNKGDNNGAGNPHNDDGINVSYMWEDILTLETIESLISNFIFIEIKDEEDADTGEKIHSENLIFPRYQQLRAVRKLYDDIFEYDTEKNYLIKHSAGSGKTNTIAWTAHILASEYDDDQQMIFDSVIVVTDRIVVDRQLQDAVKAVKKKSVSMAVMDDKCKSSDLADAINDGIRIIVTTIHKFYYILENNLLSKDKNKRFAVLIDEAHQSTEGSLMAALTTALSNEDEEDPEEIDVEEKIAEEINKIGKQPNVSMIAFTATPKGSTLQLFGTANKQGNKEAFDTYSMKQAIDEKYILNVLDNYITYKTFFTINKKIADDPELKSITAKKKILRYIDEKPENIEQKVKIMIEHFRENVEYSLDHKAKAMIVTPSIKAAIEYRLEFDKYVKENNYNLKALVAFSGKKKINGIEYSEVEMNNGLPENELRKEFDKSKYQFLIVANKYQTGFDQKKLCAMYVDKKLTDINAVQTLSRLNRIYPKYKKQTVILDFKNDYEDIKKAFGKYYEDNILFEPITPADIRVIYREIEKYDILNEQDISLFNEFIYQKKRSNSDKEKMWSLLDSSLRKVYTRNEIGRYEIKSTIRKFLKAYSFLIQATCYENIEMHKVYNFLSYLIKEIEISSGNDFDVADKIVVSEFRQEISGEHNGGEIEPDSTTIIKKPVPTSFTEEAKKKLSIIIDEINAQYGSHLNTDRISKDLLIIRDILLENNKLKQSAINNSYSDFDYSYNEYTDEALTDHYEENEEFYSMLLNDENIKRKIMNVYKRNIYDTFRSEI